MITILDGGMGGEISARVNGAGHGLWSAKALIAAPEVVLDIHREYIEAGATIITTNTYSTVPTYLRKEGLADQYVSYTRLAGKLARQAVEASGKQVLIAGALPPLSESYRPDLVPSSEEASPVYKNMVEALSAYVDLYICETMSSGQEALNTASQATTWGGGKPVYVAWTLNEDPGSGLRSGETIAEAWQKISHLDIAGFMFNCTSPEAIVAALPELKALTDKPLGCYANRMNKVPDGWTLDNEIITGRRTDLTTDYYVDMSMKCVDAGASIIGGCCGIGPPDIRSLASALAGR